jgi:formamidopyrimidine-DNA glycosylase
MPELPEVETMVRGLRPALAGRVVRRFEVLDPFLLQGCTAREISGQGAGATVVRVDRRGKWVVIALGDGRGIIVIQPRMTGGFWLVEPPRAEHIRAIFRMDGSPENVWFCDTRRLGKIAWYPDAEQARAALDRAQGPDALVIDRGELASRLRRTDRGIKPALMDQKVLAGIGNIYADEILFRAGLHPQRPSSGLRDEEISRLHGAIRPVLEEAIAAEGSSFDGGYRTVLGLEGGFLARNAVHRRRGEPCPACGEAIVKTRIAGLIGRPTYYCPGCQPLRPRRRRGPSGRVRGDRVS